MSKIIKSAAFKYGAGTEYFNLRLINEGFVFDLNSCSRRNPTQRITVQNQKGIHTIWLMNGSKLI